MFVASSYRHDKEDVARPSVSQTAAVTRPHLRVSRKESCCTYQKDAPVFVVAYRIVFRPGSKECSRVLAANCNDIFIPDVDSVDFHIRLSVHSPSMEEHIIEING